MMVAVYMASETRRSLGVGLLSAFRDAAIGQRCSDAAFFISTTSFHIYSFSRNAHHSSGRRRHDLGVKRVMKKENRFSGFDAEELETRRRDMRLRTVQYLGRTVDPSSIFQR
jgi:hypothetical protein